MTQPTDLPFGSTPAWYAPGLVPPACLAALETEWARGDDDNPEHYRWRAFRAFVAEHRPLSPAMAAALYDLGDEEADAALGASIMHAVAALPECPPEVLERARGSGRAHLVKAAARPIRPR